MPEDSYAARKLYMESSPGRRLGEEDSKARVSLEERDFERRKFQNEEAETRMYHNGRFHDYRTQEHDMEEKTHVSRNHLDPRSMEAIEREREIEVEIQVDVEKINNETSDRHMDDNLSNDGNAIDIKHNQGADNNNHDDAAYQRSYSNGSAASIEIINGNDNEIKQERMEEDYHSNNVSGGSVANSPKETLRNNMDYYTNNISRENDVDSPEENNHINKDYHRSNITRDNVLNGGRDMNRNNNITGCNDNKPYENGSNDAKEANSDEVDQADLKRQRDEFIRGKCGEVLSVMFPDFDGALIRHTAERSGYDIQKSVEYLLDLKKKLRDDEKKSAFSSYAHSEKKPCQCCSNRPPLMALPERPTLTTTMPRSPAIPSNDRPSFLPPRDRPGMLPISNRKSFVPVSDRPALLPIYEIKGARATLADDRPKRRYIEI